MMKQILLITDGCSNVGMDPAAAAAFAKSEGIVVNVVGVVDSGEFGIQGTKEIEEIAEAGGGMSRIVSTQKLAQTVQMMTRKTVAHTLHQVVHKELSQILGQTSSATRIEELPPNQRAEVVEVMDQMGEQMALRVALLIDASASMRPKLESVRDAIQDLMLSLQAREGQSEIAVFHFPAKRENVKCDMTWSTHIQKANDLFKKINMRGTTPTGPAITDAIEYFKESGSHPSLKEDGHVEDRGQRKGSLPPRDGMLGDYVG